MPQESNEQPEGPREPRPRGPVLPARRRLHRPGQRPAELYDGGRGRLRGLLGRAGPHPADVEQGLHTGPRLEQAPFATWFADGELNAAYNCVDRHVEAGHGDRVAIHFVGEPEGDTRDITYAELHEQVQRAANALPTSGWARATRRHLPADDPRGRRRDAGLRAHRRPALGRVRGVLGRGPELPHPGRGVQGRHHRRRRLPARGPVGPQAGGRRRPGQGHPGRARARGQAHRAGRRLERPRRLVARGDRAGRRHPRGAGHGGRAPALHPLHLGHHGEAEGHLPHHRRLPDAGRLHQLGRARPAPRDRRLLVHRRHRLGDRPLLHRLRPDGQRRDPGDVRGHPRHPAPGPVVGDHREVQGVDLLHGAHRDPHVHEVGRVDPAEVRPVLAARARQRG